MAHPAFRVGIGYDIHKLVENRDLIIGGVRIDYEKGLMGHSDADVLVHAVIDALLGALSLGDIGTLFPDTASEFKDADSILLLKKVVALVAEKGFGICNLDSNIIAQAPKMMPHIPKMKTVLSAALGLPPELVSIKAKTNEKMDAVGQGLAIEANAVVMLFKKD